MSIPCEWREKMYPEGQFTTSFLPHLSMDGAHFAAIALCLPSIIIYPKRNFQL
jgi:hypothetical protein